MPESFLHYDIEKKLGEGGMGVVYLARDSKLKRKVALKFLPQHVSLNATGRKRFEQEAQAAALLNHPNIAQVYAIEEDDEQFIVMEYVEGMNLKEAIEQGKLTLAEKSKIAVQIAEGIKAAHEKGIIHRDIKSSNIMIDSDGRVKIMDFGLARVLKTDHITKTGTTVGTTAYMSPEQLTGHEADTRSDIWSYGVVLYELFSGELPFKGKYEQAVMYAISEEDPVPISQIASDVPERIEHVIYQCLEKNYKQRYQNFSEVLDDLNDNIPLKDRKTKTTKAAYLYVGIFAILAFGALAFFSQFSIPPLMADGVPEKRHLAVLPIENIGGDPSLQAICDGLAETFSYKLSELEKFADSYWVAPAGELRNEKIKSVTQAKNKFGINLAILSSIQTVADSTRLILELVDAENIRRLDTEQIVVPSQNLALLEQYAVRAMLDMLQIGISPGIDKAISDGEPSDPEAYEYYLKGRANLQDAAIQDSLENAISFFQKAIEIDPEFALAHAGLGESYWRKYETVHGLDFVQKADSALNRALALNKELPQVQTLMGIIKTGTGKYEEANYHFRRALDIDPKYSQAYRELAKAYEEQGETDKAVSTYRRAIELKPDYWAGYNDLGTHYLITGHFEDAIEQLEKVIEITPGNSSAFSNLGIAYHMKGELDKARRMYETSLALEKNPLTANNLAGIYFDEKMYQEAVQMYEIVLESTPDRYDVWGNLALAQFKSGHKKEAENSYRAAIEKAHARLEVNPSNPEILADLGGYYSDVGDSAKAVKYVSDALEINTEDIRIRKQAVSIYEKMGMREEALRWVDSSMIADIESQPEFEDLAADPRYRDWKARITATKQN